MKMRGMTSGDRAAVEQLITGIEAADQHPAVGERKYLGLVDPLGVGSSPRGWVAEGREGVFAYLPLVEEEGGICTFEVAMRPDQRHPAQVEELLGRAIDAVTAEGAVGIRLWAYVPQVMDAAPKLGFQVERRLWHMRASLPLTQAPRVPPGIVIRGFREGVDEHRWLEANNQVFSGHPENGAWGLADLDRRRRLPWFSARGLRMAWDGEALAGFCWTKTPTPQAGEIYAIGVVPNYQGLGLGRTLLLEGADHMHTHQGARACVLYVDAANTPALRMYQAMGFEHHHTDRAFWWSPG